MAAEGLVVLGWFVSPIIKELVSQAQSQAASTIQLFSTNQLEQLQNVLTPIEAVIVDVEKRLFDGDPSIVPWFIEIKEAVCEAEDVLGEQSYLIVQHQRQHKFAQMVNKISCFVDRIFGLYNPDSNMNRVIQKLKEIKVHELRQLLDSAAKRSSRFTPENYSCYADFDTTSFLREEFLGREGEVAELIGVLTTDHDTSIHVVAIVGVCRIGKTSLVQKVREDPRVMDYFENIVWISAAWKHDKVEITKEILGSLINGPPHQYPNNFNDLQEMLRKELHIRKVLLVLDGVGNNWANGYEDLWNKVMIPFEEAKRGSKIVVTTRWKRLAKAMNPNNQMLLKGLSDGKCQALFEKTAFGGEEGDPALRKKGKQIVAKLNGSPYLAKEVGKKLSGNTDRGRWNSILNTEIHEEIVLHLKSTFRCFPEHLRTCVAYCSIFPRKWKFERDTLVRMWIAQGFIRSENASKREDMGREYFDELVSWSLFTRLKTKRSKTQYIIPDVMHDLAQSVSTNDCARIEGENPEKVKEQVRHVSITTNNLARLIELVPNVKKLRTLLVIRDPETSVGTIEKGTFSKLKGLRVLDLSGCDMTMLPSSIFEFIHLRYLALCKKLTSIPDPMDRLLLQVLVIPKKCPLKLPRSIADVTTMEHLDVDISCTSSISGIGKMTSLKSSIEFHVKEDKNCSNLIELRDMKNLQNELIIKNLDIVKDKEDASQAELCNKALKVLQLEWTPLNPTSQRDDFVVLEGLKPHKDLEKLHLKRYSGHSLPDWFIHEVNLKCLYLINSGNKELPPLGHLVNLLILHVKKMPSLHNITKSFYGDVNEPFKSLVELMFDQMSNWNNWDPCSTDKKPFASLQRLKIFKCPRLVTIPQVPESVTGLTIRATNKIVELKYLSSILSTGEKKAFDLYITSANISVKSLLSQEHLQYIKNLSTRKLTPATVQDLEIFASLKSLRIYKSDITDEQLNNCLMHLDSLSALEIKDCCQLDVLSLPKKVTLKELHLYHLDKLSSLVTLENNARIKELTIVSCPRVTESSFPTNFESLSSLESMKIISCSALMSLPNFPPRLKKLCLIGCNPTLAESLNSKTGFEWQKVSSIEDLDVR